MKLQEKEGKKVVVFKDKDLAIKEEKAYTKNIFAVLEGYDIEGLDEERPGIGTIAMVLIAYKRRRNKYILSTKQGWKLKLYLTHTKMY